MQEIRKNWNFKGISNLNKDELVKELLVRIPGSVKHWLGLLTDSIYHLIKELLKQDGFIYVNVENENDLLVLKYLQLRGIAFYGTYEGDIILVMPEELLQETQGVISFNSEINTRIAQNTELTLLTVGFLVYYGVCPTFQLLKNIEEVLNQEIDNYQYFQLVHEFTEAFNIIYHNYYGLALKYVIDPEWVLEEQNKRSQIEYYQVNKGQLLYAGRNLLPPLNQNYQDLQKFLRSCRIDKDNIEEILSALYLDINNDGSLSELMSRVMEMLDFNSEKQLRELNQYLLPLYNNTHQWVLKGHTPAAVSDITGNKADNSSDDKVVNLASFRKYKEKKAGTITRIKDVRRNDPCPCGSGKKYKKCCLKEDQRKELLRNKLESGGEIDDRFLSRFDYIKEVGYPLVKHDFFLLEIVNITGYILDAYNRYGKIKQVDIESLLIEVVNKGKEFYNYCRECEQKCLDNPSSGFRLNSLREEGIEIDSFSVELQRETALNNYYFRLINALVAVFDTKILAEGNSKEQAQEICQHIIDHIAGFIVESCYESCGNNCIINHADNAYCDFCTFSSPPLPCPRKGEISYQEIKASEEDMLQHD